MNVKVGESVRASPVCLRPRPGVLRAVQILVARARVTEGEGREQKGRISNTKRNKGEKNERRM